MQEELLTHPLSEERKVTGSRRLVREKALQVLMAYEICELEIEKLFRIIFFRNFNFGDEEEKQDKVLTQTEVTELEADIPIQWKQDEIEFGRLLIEKVIGKREKLNLMIRDFTANWELERIAFIDKILMQMAIVELLEFDEIPTKVSINEAIDIAKKYSTPKSGTFINGVLDSIYAKLSAEGKIKKTGRGTIDS
jgi:transcription antitermination protein NusB